MTGTREESLIVRSARLVPVRGSAPDQAVDVRVRGGVVTEVGPGLRPRSDERVLDADGRWLIPGLWDAHVHLDTWARSSQQLDVGGTAGPEAVVARVAAAATALDGDGRQTELIEGHGFRSGGWSRPPTVAELDAVSGLHPVVLTSGDVHNGWLNSPACRLLGLAPRTGPLEESDWFSVMHRLSDLSGERERLLALRAAVVRAAGKGVVGVGDMELEAGFRRWPERVAAGVDLLRVRPATYAVGLDDVIAAGVRTGNLLEPTGLVRMGPLKVIFDGSVNTRTAFCCEPYPGSVDDATWRGLLNVTPDELTRLCAQAHRAGLEVAVHAIGDAAVTAALDALELSGARGSLEHVQLLAPADLPRFAGLGVTASVQPAHLLDDRDLTLALWPDRQERCFALRSLLDAGATLRLGSDAPVAALDPWLAMAAAVHRSADERPAWTPDEALTPAEALAASVDGAGTVGPGSLGDLALLDHDPLARARDATQAAARLRAVSVAATVVGGRVTHDVTGGSGP